MPDLEKCYSNNPLLVQSNAAIFRYVFLVLHARPRNLRSSDHIYRGVLSSIRPSIVCSGGLCFPSDPPYLEYIRIHTSNIRVHTSNIRIHTDEYGSIQVAYGYIGYRYDCIGATYDGRRVINTKRIIFFVTLHFYMCASHVLQTHATACVTYIITPYTCHTRKQT